MSDRLQWILDLQDRLSGPAARMERQLGQVRAQLKALDIAAKQNALDKITDPLKRQRAELQLQRDKLLLSKAALDKTGASARRAGADAGFFTRQLHDILHIAQIVGGALERVGFTVRNMMKAISFRESEMIGLKTFLGGKAGGVFDRMTDLAARTGRSAEELVGLAKSLAMAGKAGQDLEPIIKRLAGLNTISAGSGNTVGGIIASMFAAGKGGAGDIEALRGTPIRPEKILEDLAEKFTGKRDRIVGQKIAENRAGLDPEGLTRLFMAEADRLGAGKAALAGGRTVEGRFQGVVTQMNRMFERLSPSAGISSLKGVLKNLQDMFNPEKESGQKTLATLTRISDTIAKAFEPFTGTEGRERMKEFFTDLGELIDAVIPKLVTLAGWTAKAVSFFAARMRDKTATQRLSEEMLAQIAPETSSAFEEFSKPVYGQRSAPLAPVVVQISQRIDARGASKEDAEQIANRAAQRAKDALTDALKHANVQQGGR